MAEASIPVDLFNPGQVFACLGFLEAAEALLGDAQGGFDWSDPSNVRFSLSGTCVENPIERVLDFIANTTPQRYAPFGYVDPPPKKKGKSKDRDEEDEDSDGESAEVATAATPPPPLSETFPSRSGDALSLPVRIGGEDKPLLELGHWADGSGRETFKLYSGNRSAERIARAMLLGTREKPKKPARIPKKEPSKKTATKIQAHAGEDIKTKGVSQLWQEQRAALIQNPFNVLTPLGGSFNFDPRGAWTAIDAGYSPNTLKHAVAASPVVQFLAAWGLEHARPVEYGVRKVRYSVWGLQLSPMLARVALQGQPESLPYKHFRFELALSGKNKIVTFAQTETLP